MAEQDQINTLASTYPDPPPFYKDFTPDRISRIEELREAYVEAHGGDAHVTRVPGVPDDLVNLQPPAEPVDGKWRVFGDSYTLDDKLPTLEEQGIANLPDAGPSDSRDAKHFDRAFELKRLAKSLLLNFLELSGTLSRNPAHAEPKVQDLRTIFINFHHILNEYRPHQARESAIAMMQDHLDRTRTETVAIRTQVDKARRVLEGLESLSVPEVPPPLGQQSKPESKPESKGQRWKAKAKAKVEAEKDGEALELERDAELWATADALFD